MCTGLCISHLASQITDIIIKRTQKTCIRLLINQFSKKLLLLNDYLNSANVCIRAYAPVFLVANNKLFGRIKIA